MKSTRILFAFLFLPASTVSLPAETLRSEGPLSVHLRPDSGSPVIGEIEPGSRLVEPDEPVVLGPDQTADGWRAIAFDGDFEAWVRRGDLSKDLEVEPGAPIYHTRDASPQNIVTVIDRNDDTTVGSLSGRWADVRVRKKVPGFIQYEAPAPEGTDDDDILEGFAQDEEPEPPRAQPLPSGPPITEREAIPTDGSLRLFEGYLSEPRTFLGRETPYPYQVVTERGNRIAYLDLSRLLITTPLEQIMNYRFEFYGRAERIENRRDFVIRVENMRTK